MDVFRSGRKFFSPKVEAAARAKFHPAAFPRARLICGDSTDAASVAKAGLSPGSQDVVIDDGDHSF